MRWYRTGYLTANNALEALNYLNDLGVLPNNIIIVSDNIEDGIIIYYFADKELY